MGLLYAIQQVLSLAGKPLGCDEITKRVLAAKLWDPGHRDPQEAVAGLLRRYKSPKSSPVELWETLDGRYVLSPSASSRKGQPDETPQARRLLDAIRQVLSGANLPLTATEIQKRLPSERPGRRAEAIVPLLRRHSKGQNAVFVRDSAGRYALVTSAQRHQLQERDVAKLPEIPFDAGWSGNASQEALEVMSLAQEKRSPGSPRPVPPPVATVQWEILPPGTGPEVAGPRTRGGKARSGEALERLDFLWGLRPSRIWRGVPLEGTREYLAFEFPRLVIVDCPDYGNALYYYPCRPDWQKVFSLTKREARHRGAKRLMHAGDWQGRVKKLLKAKPR